MNSETIFQYLVILLFTVGAVIGFSHRYKAQKAGGGVSHKEEGLPILIALRLTGLAVWLSLFTYMINPAWMNWSSLPLPIWLRWLGVCVIVLALPLLYWLFRSIGNNITDTVATRKGHQLVTHGPYRWVRHPLYSVGTVLFFSFGVVAANWFIISMSVLGLILLLIRLPREEAELVKTFGDAYRQYTQQTGRLLPKF